MEAFDILRYSLYALTVAFGLALVIWLLLGRRGSTERSGRTSKLRTAGAVTTDGSQRITAVRGIASRTSMAEALAGVRLPVHWQTDPSGDVRSPLALTTSSDSPGEMAALMSNELARLGYYISPTSATTAKAQRGDVALSVEVTSTDHTVTTRLTLSEASNG